MSDEQGIGRTARNNFALGALLFCGGLIVWLVLYGKAENSLHASALSWSFTVFGGVLAAIGFGAISTLLLPYRITEPQTARPGGSIVSARTSGE